VFADDGYVYAGKFANLSHRISQWSGELRKKNGDGLVNVVVVPYCGTDIDLSSIPSGCTLADFLARDQGDELGFEMVPFSQPAFILYSSGTASLVPSSPRTVADWQLGP
jgi:acetoacetyl-CoA synthetase